MPGQIVDVSGGGCRVELREPLEKGDLVRVVLHGAEDTTHLTLGAEVRWHRTTPDGVTVAGLRFTGTTALLASKVLGMVPITSTSSQDSVRGRTRVRAGFRPSRSSGTGDPPRLSR